MRCPQVTRSCDTQGDIRNASCLPRHPSLLPTIIPRNSRSCSSPFIAVAKSLLDWIESGGEQAGELVIRFMTPGFNSNPNMQESSSSPQDAQRSAAAQQAKCAPPRVASDEHQEEAEEIPIGAILPSELLSRILNFVCEATEVERGRTGTLTKRELGRKR